MMDNPDNNAINAILKSYEELYEQCWWAVNAVSDFRKKHPHIVEKLENIASRRRAALYGASLEERIALIEAELADRREDY